jgi:hypothetical protein
MTQQLVLAKEKPVKTLGRFATKMDTLSRYRSEVIQTGLILATTVIVVTFIVLILVHAIPVSSHQYLPPIIQPNFNGDK